MGSFRARWLATTPTWCAGSSPSAHRQRVGPVHTTFGRAYSASELARIAEAAEERAARPIAVPLTAIRSRREGIVAPDACVDNRTPGAENLVVGSTHIGMGLDPDVWRIVADRLVRPDAPGALR